MSQESQEQRIARLNGLLSKVWPDYVDDGIHVSGNGHEFEVISKDDGDGVFVLASIQHPRALDALEAALSALAGEPPQWAVDLANKWKSTASKERERSASVAAKIQGDTLVGCAHRLILEAKGGAR